ncbi:uncharacterized protein MELLADRAFT_108565 [Melampsora larici-populina 98AG31]|uniref:Uncharacterized protein n=1 Tax=Melampsora larici-populina (strain 98AG31 / pathotype 3-4-7) TaxID=747676 RepID=F4RTI0_MELLP|nr:uncharacterized protein MELLADRAFT_108565 [Melampsora larici-populina 98AG31]EGG04333.1 hypothetical protein MELLADRAFT_108565 [Melampsora larici-populina 98AG31]
MKPTNQNKKKQTHQIKCSICEIQKQTNCPGTRSKNEETINRIKSQETQPIEEPKEEILQEERPLKRLKDLRWPELDEAQCSVFYDPLRRDEIKPLRKFEWERIVTCIEFRTFLRSSSDSFKETLKRIHLEPNENLRHELIKELVGFEFDQGSFIHQKNQNQKNRQKESIRFGLEDRKVFEEFGEIVKKILDQTRGT